MEKSLVSVIMATHNTPLEYLKESIESILMQTYANFEFIIIDDASTDEIDQLIKAYNDKRIKLIRNEINLGLTKSLNIGIKFSQGEYIARMDADDISLPNRFELQVEYLKKNPLASVLGTRAVKFGDEEKVLKSYLKETREEQQIKLFYYNIGLIHPTLMIRREFLEKHSIRYNEKLRKTQDYGLWVECIKYTKLHIVNTVLLKYRTHLKQISRANTSEQSKYGSMVRLSQLKDLDIELDTEVEKIHSNFCNGISCKNIERTKKWKDTLIHQNDKLRTFDVKLFRNETQYMWFLLCAKEFIKNKRMDFIIPFIKSLRFNYIIEYLKYHKSRY